MPTVHGAPRTQRARLGWWLIALIGFAFLVGPVFTHGGLTTQHIAAHLITGPAMIALSFVQLRQLHTRSENGYRLIDWILAACGLWLVALPFVVPADGLHIHGHAAAGLVAASAAVWNALSPPQIPS